MIADNSEMGTHDIVLDESAKKSRMKKTPVEPDTPITDNITHGISLTILWISYFLFFLFACPHFSAQFHT